MRRIRRPSNSRSVSLAALECSLWALSTTQGGGTSLMATGITTSNDYYALPNIRNRCRGRVRDVCSFLPNPFRKHHRDPSHHHAKRALARAPHNPRLPSWQKHPKLHTILRRKNPANASRMAHPPEHSESAPPRTPAKDNGDEALNLQEHLSRTPVLRALPA